MRVRARRQQLPPVDPSVRSISPDDVTHRRFRPPADDDLALDVASLDLDQNLVRQIRARLDLANPTQPRSHAVGLVAPAAPRA